MHGAAIDLQVLHSLQNYLYDLRRQNKWSGCPQNTCDTSKYKASIIKLSFFLAGQVLQQDLVSVMVVANFALSSICNWFR